MTIDWNVLGPHEPLEPVAPKRIPCGGPANEPRARFSTPLFGVVSNLLCADAQAGKNTSFENGGLSRDDHGR